VAKVGTSISSVGELNIATREDTRGEMPEPTQGSPTHGHRLQLLLERGLFAARWLMAPVYIVMVLLLLLIVIKIVQQFVTAIPDLLTLDVTRLIMLVLSLIDLSLAGNLVLVVVLSGYENFVSRLNLDEKDRPAWLGTIDFAGLKLKLLASIVAIASIDLLKTFLDIQDEPPEQVLLRLGLYIGFVVAGVLLALMDRIIAKEHGLD
jgi:uncharacterized protein (TIGR00645 family)